MHTEKLDVKLAKAEKIPITMTYEEFLSWVDEDTRAEWVDGEVIVHMPPKNPHQTLVEFLHHVIGLFVRVFDLGRLRVAPFELKLPDGAAREPDLMFLSKEHLDRLTDERVVGTPDLIIEIVSQDSVHRDRVDKFDEYEAAGVPEYWILDNRPGQRRARFYQLGLTGQYQPVPADEQDVYHCKVIPNFWLRLEWLWEPEPDPLEAIAAIIGPDQFADALRRSMDE